MTMTNFDLVDKYTSTVHFTKYNLWDIQDLGDCNFLVYGVGINKISLLIMAFLTYLF